MSIFEKRANVLCGAGCFPQALQVLWVVIGISKHLLYHLSSLCQFLFHRIDIKKPSIRGQVIYIVYENVFTLGFIRKVYLLVQLHGIFYRTISCSDVYLTKGNHK
jgi:hypothetical protein